MKKLGILGIVVMLASCGIPRSFPGGPVTVQVGTVQVSPIEDTSDFMTTLTARHSISVQSQISGKVTQILIKPGDQVPNNAALVVIDPTPQEVAMQSNKITTAMTQAEISSRTTDLQSAQTELTNAKLLLQATQASQSAKILALVPQRQSSQNDQELFSAGAISQRQLENRNNDLKIAETALQSLEQEIISQQTKIAELEVRTRQAQTDLKLAHERLQQSQTNAVSEKVKLEFHQIVAPFTAKVENIPIKVGDIVKNTTELLTIAQTDQLEIEVAIPVERASQLQEGLSVKILDDRNTEIAKGQVFFVSPTANTKNQTVLVKATFDNTNKKLNQDQLVRIRVVWDSRPGVKIPTSAITQQAGQSFVYIPETIQTTNGKTKVIAKQHPIELGKSLHNDQEILTGLKPQDRLILSEIKLLRDGTEIETEPK